MIKGLHIRLTVYLSVIITIIMLALCAVYIYITSSNINNRNKLEYENTITSFYSYLYNNNVINYTNITEYTDKGFFIEITSGNHAQKFGAAAIPDADIIIDDIDITSTYEYWENYHNSIQQKTISHTEFFYNYEKVEYWVSHGIIQNMGKSYTVILLYSTFDNGKEIFKLCVIFSLIALIATILLYIVSYFFVGKVLVPVEEAHNKQEEFIAIASHELKSPLTVIKASLSAMAKPDSEDFKHYKSIADAEVSRMSDLINDMLILANTKKGDKNIVLTDCDPTDIIIKCYNRFENLVYNKGLAFHVSLPEQPLQHYKLDEERITQLMIILLDNALSYTQTGAITLSAYEEHGKLRMSVADTGIGIPNDIKNRIFDKFYSADKSHSQNEHYGLGLSIAKEIAALHNAVITVSDNETRGSIFTVLFP